MARALEINLDQRQQQSPDNQNVQTTECVSLLESKLQSQEQALTTVTGAVMSITNGDSDSGQAEVEPRTPRRRRANPDAKPGPKLAKNFVDSEFQAYGSLTGVGPKTSTHLRRH